jgi:hypothetical protein
MLVAVAKAAPLFLTRTHFLEGIGTGIAVLGIWFKYIWPWSKSHILRWRDDRLLMRGRPETDAGPGQESLGRRLKRQDRRLDSIEHAQNEQVAVTTRLDNGQIEIIKRQDEHAETVARVQEDVAIIKDGQNKALQMLGHLFENGQNSNNPGDLAARNAKALGTYLKDPQISTFDPHSEPSA